VTKQETFDAVVGAVLAQGRPSAELRGTEDIRCLYRSSDGCKCAAGHLIPDADYQPHMEGGPVDGLRVLQDVLIREGHDIALVRDLQIAHDGAARRSRIPAPSWAGFDGARFVDRFKENARDVAAKFGLSARVAA
jgi:hypothetical protein